MYFVNRCFNLLGHFNSLCNLIGQTLFKLLLRSKVPHLCSALNIQTQYKHSQMRPSVCLLCSFHVFFCLFSGSLQKLNQTKQMEQYHPCSWGQHGTVLFTYVQQKEQQRPKLLQKLLNFLILLHNVFNGNKKHIHLLHTISFRALFSECTLPQLLLSYFLFKTFLWVWIETQSCHLMDLVPNSQLNKWIESLKLTILHIVRNELTYLQKGNINVLLVSL